MLATRTVAVFALTLLVLAPAAIAEDEPTPRDRFLDMVKSLDAPSDANAFEFKGSVFFGPQAAGTFRFAAKPGKDGDTVVWELRDEMNMMGGQYTMGQTTLVRKDLDLIRGEAQEQTPHQTPVTRTYARNEGKITTKLVSEGAEPKSTTVEPKGLATTGLASLFLIARLGMPADGKAGTKIAMDVFDSNFEADDPQLEEGTITFKGMGTWNDKPAYIVVGTKGSDKTIEIGLDPKTREVLGAKMTGPGQPPVELRPAASEAEKPKGPFDELARTDTQAALQAMLGFACAEFEILDRVIHWPTLYAAKDEAYRAETDLETFRKIVNQELRDSVQKRVERAMMEMMLPGVASQLERTELDNGHTLIVFPEMFKSMKMEVGKVGDHWFLMKMPGAPEEGK